MEQHWGLHGAAAAAAVVIVAIQNVIWHHTIG